MTSNRVVLGLALVILTNQAQATSAFPVVQCSGAVQQVEQPNVDYACEGDLLLSTGRISSAGDITISATRSITLQSMIIEGKTVTLKSDTIGFGSDTRISVLETLLLNSNSPTVFPVVNIAQSGVSVSPGGPSSPFVPSATGTGYVLNNIPTSIGVEVSPATFSVAAAPVEQEGGGLTSVAFLLGLLLAVQLLSGRHVA